MKKSCLKLKEKRMRLWMLAYWAIMSPYLVFMRPDGMPLWVSLCVVAFLVAIAKPFCHIMTYMYEEDAAYYRVHGHCPCPDCEKDHANGSNP